MSAEPLEERELKRYREPEDTVIIHVDMSLGDIKLTTPSSNHRWRLPGSLGMGAIWSGVVRDGHLLVILTEIRMTFESDCCSSRTTDKHPNDDILSYSSYRRFDGSSDPDVDNSYLITH